MSFAFVLYADVVLAAVLLTFDSPSVVLPLAALFTVMGSYVVGFHGPKLFTAHHIFAFVTVAALYTSAMVNDPAQRLQTNLCVAHAVVDSRNITDRIDNLLGRADKAMYQAKRLGGDRVAVSDESTEDVPIDDRL